MNKYKIFPVEKPELNQLIWYIGPVAKEILGYFLGSTTFVEADGTKKGYFAKYWRETTPEEKLLPTWNPEAEPVIEKRKYKKRAEKEEI